MADSLILLLTWASFPVAVIGAVMIVACGIIPFLPPWSAK